MYKKCTKQMFSFILLILFISSALNTAIASVHLTHNSSRNLSTVLYVGGLGPGNFTNIQDAIDNASNGDTIFVFSGVYHENVFVDKQLTIIGESRDETVIDGGYGKYAVEIISDAVCFSGFTVSDCTGYYNAGIMIFSDFNYISNNFVTNNRDGIRCEGSNNSISKNFVFDNFNGIYLVEATYNYIFRNTIEKTLRTGINVEISSNFNEFVENTVTLANWYGIGFGESSDNNTIYHNNFVLNRWHAYDECSNSWNDKYPSCGNYWDDYDGVDEYSGKNQNHPTPDGIGDTPYYIEGNGNFDCYPFMFPYIPYPKIEIEFVSQGLQICAVIKNVGSNDAINVSWGMSFDGGLLILPRNHNVSGTFPVILAESEEIICISGFLFGLGLINLYVEADAENAAKITKQISFFLLGPFIFIIEV